MIKNPLESVQPEDTKLYGIYRGVVEDNSSDPNKAGRIKVRVFGIHTPQKEKTDTEGIPTNELPWAEPALNLFEGSVSGYGSFTIPLQGSHVFVFFENGNPMKPIYFASIPGIPENYSDPSKGFNDPDGNFPDKTNEPDWNRLGRNEQIQETIVSIKEAQKRIGISRAIDLIPWNELDPQYNASYPYNKVFATHNGIVIEIDDTSGSERLHIYHPSHTYIEINEKGTLIFRNAKDKYELTDQNEYKTIGSEYHRTVEGSIRSSLVLGEEKLEVKKSQEEHIGINRNILVKGNESLFVMGKEEDVTSMQSIKNTGKNDDLSAQTINRDAQTINLNSGKSRTLPSASGLGFTIGSGGIPKANNQWWSNI